MLAWAAAGDWPDLANVSPMNRIHALCRTPLLAVERFDHPPHCEPLAAADEEASGFAINIVERGEFAIRAGRRTARAVPGSLFCTEPGFRFTCEHPDGPPEDSCLTVSFGAGSSEAWFRASSWPTRGDGAVRAPSNRRSYAVRRFVSRIGGPQLALEEAAIELVEAATNPGEPPPGRLFKASQLSWYAARVDRARERIDAHYAADHSLAELAADVGMSPFHFARVFRELAGAPPHRYLLERRLTVAQRLLADGASVTEALYATGFVSASHFSRAFRRYRGVSPSEWKRGEASRR